MMISRRAQADLQAALRDYPAVALLGPRQVGKTTLALAVAGRQPSVYLDLESDADRSKLSQPEIYLGQHADHLVVIDEIHRAPGLFPVLRGLIDQGRRAGRRAGRFLLLGSASIDLMQQSGESLAGRIAYRELRPLDVLEAGTARASGLWTRGGFPDSLLARNDDASMAWRRDFIRTYLERDVAQFGPRIPAETLRRLWTMLAHGQGTMLNVAEVARSMGMDAKTVARYIDLLADLLLVRRLPPWHANVGKRLVKSPRIWVRDSGLVHALLGIANHEALLGHPVAGASWEGFVIENLVACAGPDVQAYFYRTAVGAEVDLLLSWPGGEIWAIEIKRSLAPKLARGFHVAVEDLKPVRSLVVCPGGERHRLATGIEAVPLVELARELADAGGKLR